MSSRRTSVMVPNDNETNNGDHEEEDLMGNLGNLLDRSRLVP